VLNHTPSLKASVMTDEPEQYSIDPGGGGGGGVNGWGEEGGGN
jgi:hypothetical protein